MHVCNELQKLSLIQGKTITKFSDIIIGSSYWSNYIVNGNISEHTELIRWCCKGWSVIIDVIDDDIQRGSVCQFPVGHNHIAREGHWCSRNIHIVITPDKKTFVERFNIRKNTSGAMKNKKSPKRIRKLTLRIKILYWDQCLTQNKQWRKTAQNQHRDLWR